MPTESHNLLFGETASCTLRQLQSLRILDHAVLWAFPHLHFWPFVPLHFCPSTPLQAARLRWSVRRVMCTHLRYGAATKSVGLASQPGGFSDPREACRCNVFGFFSVRFDFSSCAWLSRELSEGDEAETARGVEQTVLFRGFLRRCVTASSLLRERPCAPPLPSRERELKFEQLLSQSPF